MSEIIPRQTVRQVCEIRDRTLELYENAHKSLSDANTALSEAMGMAHNIKVSTNRYNHHLNTYKDSFLFGIDVPSEEAFMDHARRFIDTQAWSHIIELTNIEYLMDKKAKDELYKSLIDNPPEVTEENIYATLQSLYLEADTIFKRGIAECFSNLDRRFRSHNPWKFGSRVILTGTFDEFGYWSYYSNHRDTLQDIERVFFIIDGKEPPLNYTGIVGAVNKERESVSDPTQSLIESNFFKVRCFKNGNMHVWFKRDDLVKKVNKLLGEYYNGALAESTDYEKAKDDHNLNKKKTAVAKNYAFFPTPESVVDLVKCRLNLNTYQRELPLRVLEPSAGTGNLASNVLGEDIIVDCVEIQHKLALELQESGNYGKVIHADFLTVQPDSDNLYDRVVMNPPFDLERDIDHVMHALKFLKPDGQLVAIMSAGTEFRGTKKSVAFRKLMKKKNATWLDLPMGSFSSVGTNVNTIILSVWNDGRNRY